MHRFLGLLVVCALLSLATGCSSGDGAPKSAVTPASASAPIAPENATEPSGEVPEINARYGCGPTDGAEIAVEAHNLGPGDVIVQVVFNDTVYNMGQPKAGPEVNERFEPGLPTQAYDAGTAEARIVSADEPTETIVSTDFSLGASCG